MVREIAPDGVALIRRFNRTVTERIGALEESFLGRERPLGASRLLWEIGEDGADLHELRDRLGVDSGYASRLVRRLENEGLVAVEADPVDGRRRRLRPTAAGLAEVRELDRLSDLAAAALLDGVPTGHHERLLAAIAEVERSLRATLVGISVEEPHHPDVVHCFARYANELDARFPGGFDAAKSISANPEELTPPAGYCVVARLRGRPIGCGALKLHGAGPAGRRSSYTAGPGSWRSPRSTTSPTPTTGSGRLCRKRRLVLEKASSLCSPAPRVVGARDPNGTGTPGPVGYGDSGVPVPYVFVYRTTKEWVGPARIVAARVCGFFSSPRSDFA